MSVNLFVIIGSEVTCTRSNIFFLLLYFDLIKLFNQLLVVFLVQLFGGAIRWLLRLWSNETNCYWILTFRALISSSSILASCETFSHQWVCKVINIGSNLGHLAYLLKFIGIEKPIHYGLILLGYLIVYFRWILVIIKWTVMLSTIISVFESDFWYIRHGWALWAWCRITLHNLGSNGAVGLGIILILSLVDKLWKHLASKGFIKALILSGLLYLLPYV